MGPENGGQIMKDPAYHAMLRLKHESEMINVQPTGHTRYFGQSNSSRHLCGIHYVLYNVLRLYLRGLTLSS